MPGRWRSTTPAAARGRGRCRSSRTTLRSGTRVDGDRRRVSVPGHADARRSSPAAPTARSPGTCSCVATASRAASRSGGGSRRRSSPCAERAHAAPARALRRRHPRPAGARRRVPLPGGTVAAGRCRRASPAPSRCSSVRITRAASRTSASWSSSAARARASSRASFAAATRTGSPATRRCRSTRTRTSTEFGSPVPAAGALRPAPGDYYVVFDSPTRGRGRDVPLPLLGRRRRHRRRATVVRRTVRTGEPIRIRVADAGSGVDVRSIEATLDGRHDSRTADRLGDQDPDHGPLRRAAPAPRRARRLPGDAEQRERHAHPARTRASSQHWRDDRAHGKRRGRRRGASSARAGGTIV